ncbi:hypothetical protein [Legionella sp. km772]|uniref:hypothetical protein n=1 Tax=Legionella sp. km772 TaxID=2498111 RepID=UPI000F8CC999|nr:hypothetical protein [Legionella sp. km772]RUR06457.1 hypothetical protein ELY15_13200 [Legionella sp. km772]
MPINDSTHISNSSAVAESIEESSNAGHAGAGIDDAESVPTPRSSDPININDEFESSGVVQSESSVSHTIDKGRLKGSSEIWYRKEFSDPATARREWLAQEFLRLIIPNQTETRLAFDPRRNVYYILSKEVSGFKPLPTGQHEKFSNGTYKGLGSIIIGAYFVHEADLKNGNIGLDDHGTVHKIDGDWSFASMRSNSQFPKHTGAIAALQINRLPFPMTYKAHNWLDIFIEGSLASASDIVASDIASSRQFQQEKFETLFKLLLIPDEYLVSFVDSFMPAGAKEYSDFLIERRHTLLKQVPKLQGFAQYLKDHREDVEELACEFTEELEEFVVQGKYSVLLNSKKHDFGDKVKTQFHEVLNKLNIQPEPESHAEPEPKLLIVDTPSSTPTPSLSNHLESLGLFKNTCHLGVKRKLAALIEEYESESHSSLRL